MLLKTAISILPQYFLLAINTIKFVRKHHSIRMVSHFFSGPCHHGMARPQVADEETASDMEGSCE